MLIDSTFEGGLADVVERATLPTKRRATGDPSSST